MSRQSPRCGSAVYDDFYSRLPDQIHRMRQIRSKKRTQRTALITLINLNSIGIVAHTYRRFTTDSRICTSICSSNESNDAALLPCKSFMCGNSPRQETPVSDTKASRLVSAASDGWLSMWFNT